METSVKSRVQKKKPGHYRHGDLANALLDAAERLVAARHGADFTLREIADAVGVSHPAVYRHYASRELLVSALAGRTFAAMLTRFKAVRSGAQDGFRAWSDGLARVYFETVVKEPGAYRIMFTQTPVDDAARDAAAQACFEELVECYGAGQAEGKVRMDLPARAIAVAVWAGLHGLAALMLDRRLPMQPDASGQPQLVAVLREVMQAGWTA